MSAREGAVAVCVTDAERFLNAVLVTPRADHERYRFEVFDGAGPLKISARAKNYLEIAALAQTLVTHGESADAYVALGSFPAGGESRAAAAVRRLAVVWADLDCGAGKPHATKADALARLGAFPLPSTMVIESGNGIHAYWRLDEPTADVDRVVAIVRGVGRVLDADPSVADAARIMRVPGTWNRKRGNAEPLPVTLISIDEDITYSIDAFADAGVPEIAGTAAHRDVQDAAEPAERSGLPVGARGWQFVAEGAPVQQQRTAALASARSFIGAGYSIDETADYVWRGLQASPVGDPDNPWTYEEALAIAADIARRPAPPLEAPAADDLSWVNGHDQRDQRTYSRGNAINAINAISPAGDEHSVYPAYTAYPGAMADEAFHGLAGDVVRAIDPHTEADPALCYCNSWPPSAPPPAGALTSASKVTGRSQHQRGAGGRHLEGSQGHELGARNRPHAFGESSMGVELHSAGAQLRRRPDLGGTRCDPQDGGDQGPEDEGNHRLPNLIIDEGVEDKRLLVVESELASTLRVMGRDGNTLSPILRQAWDSGDLRTLTKNSPAVATGAHISTIGHITGDELRRYLDRTEIANGYGNRNIWICTRRSRSLPEGGGAIDGRDDLVDGLALALDFAGGSP